MRDTALFSAMLQVLLHILVADLVEEQEQYCSVILSVPDQSLPYKTVTYKNHTVALTTEMLASDAEVRN